MSERARILVVGIGNRFRSDDGVGPEVVRRLRDHLPRDIEVAEHMGDGAALLRAWSGVDAAIIVDAVRSGAEPGTVHRIDVKEQGVPWAFNGFSTHGFGLADAVELARASGRLPELLVVYGVEGSEFGHGTAFSQAVSRSLHAVVTQVLADVSAIVAG